MNVTDIKSLSNKDLDKALAEALGLAPPCDMYQGVLLHFVHGDTEMPCFASDHAAAHALGSDMANRGLAKQYITELAKSVNDDRDPAWEFQYKVAQATPRQRATAALTVILKARERYEKSKAGK